MEHKLSQFETEADVPKANGRGSEGLPRALAECDLGSPRPDLNRRCVRQCQSLYLFAINGTFENRSA